MVTKEVKEKLDKLNPKSIILFGIETHNCVLNTALDLISMNKYDIYVVMDALDSVIESNHIIGIKSLLKCNILPTSTSSLIYDILRRNDLNEFDSIYPLIKYLDFPKSEKLNVDLIKPDYTKFNNLLMMKSPVINCIFSFFDYQDLKTFKECNNKKLYALFIAYNILDIEKKLLKKGINL